MIALFKCILYAAVLENKTHEALNHRKKGLSPKYGERVSVYNYPTLLGNVTIFGKQAFEINKRNVSAWNICYAPGALCLAVLVGISSGFPACPPLRRTGATSCCVMPLGFLCFGFLVIC